MFLLLVLVFGIGGVIILTGPRPSGESSSIFNPSPGEFSQLISEDVPTTSEKPQVQLIEPSLQKTLPTSYHAFQTFNNCGPAALSMALSHYGIQVSQQELGQSLRPYQVAGGDNDDKSVTLEELAEKSKEYGLIPYHRPNGSIELMKQFITYDMPVITRTFTKPSEDIGHYRVVKGYDDVSKQIVQDDSLQGNNLTFSYSGFNELWRQFNYEYLVMVPKDKVEIAKAILKNEVDPRVSWQKAVSNAETQLVLNSQDIFARFNLSVALFHVGDFQRSVNEFEQVESRLPFRALWYQIEPIQAYYELGNYERVFQITDAILKNHNRAFSELYLIRGKIYKKQGNIDLAKQEFEKAVFYNQNLKAAKDALAAVNSM